MTADQATYAAILALDDAASCRTYAARARKSSEQRPTSAQSRPATSANHLEALPLHSAPHPLADTGRAGPHPIDVIFWVACLGGACLLLFSATM